jgi:hypothetical protein
MPYRVAADVMEHLLPIDAGTSPETLRSHTLLIGEQLGDAAAETSPAAAAITISLDSTFIRSRDDGERHLIAGGRQVFGAVTRAATDIIALTQRTLTWRSSGQGPHQGSIDKPPVASAPQV